ncbi:hypothetical protein [Pseudoduganella namucuonensis]|uniref:hypothetical protein n=1 Tax=Pseudoduganella namucuonensis TaxID=1035707 RepID=UPI000B82CF51|nr:hypothetical protein [Pseudoduganella namucuonensis]
MQRAELRKLRQAAARHDAEAILYLLQRSVKFGHKRLALLRCIQAERMGATVAPELLRYCRGVAAHTREDVLHRLMRQACEELKGAVP